MSTTTYDPLPATLDPSNSSAPIEILLYGLGAIGAFYAFILQRSPTVRLSVVARSNYTAVKTNGLLMKSENHGEHLFHPKAVYRRTKEAQGQVFDYIVCCNKATDPNGTAKDLKDAGIVDVQKTTIVLMQNGVGNEDPFEDEFPGITILSGVVWVGATQDSPGVVRQHIAEGTTIGIFSRTPSAPSTTSTTPFTPAEQCSLSLFTSLLTFGAHPHTVSPTIQTARWQKCIWNAAWNSLTTLTGADCHTWLSSSVHATNATLALMHEAVKVAVAMGIPGIDENLPQELVDRMIGLKGPVYTSMYHDARAGRAMEVDVILGSIVRWGRERGVAVPTLEVLYAMLVALGVRIERDQLGQGGSQ